MTLESLLIDLFNFPEAYGFIAAILTTIAFLPQLIRTLKTRSADDISFLMLILFIIGLLFWIVYGIAIESKPIIVANLITFSLNICILFLKILYKNTT